VIDDAQIECVCHGISGSCAVQTCYKKVPDIENVGEKLLTKYDIAKHVERSTGSSSLIPADPESPQLNSAELGYCKTSPDFCKRDLPNGIYGSSGRQCWPDRNGPSNCNTLCCNGEIIKKEVEKIEEHCEFVWCCEIRCTVINRYNETEYFCK